MGSDFNIAIVGGGISGLTLAIVLLDAGVDATIYEAAPSFAEIGAGVHFGPNAAQAMELLSPKVYEAFLQCKTGNQWESKQNTWFTIRVGDERKADKDGFVKPGLKVGDAWFDMDFSKPCAQGGVYRAHFLDKLVEHVPKSAARFGKKLVDIEQVTDGSGDVILKFEDGTSARHNAVIGCDGIKSKTREIVLGSNDPAARPVFSGKYAYRGLIPMDKAIDLLGAEVAQNANFYFGYHGHLLTFPVANGKTFNVVAFSSRESWDNPAWVVSTSKEEMLSDFDGWGKTVQDIVGAMEKPDIWALFMHLPASTFLKGRICLLGDAAHATTPHQGAGAGMCIEDALIMSRLLKDAKNVGDVDKAFSAYDEIRRPRGLKNVVTSHQAGQLYDFEFEGDDLDKIEANCADRMKWVWDEDLEGQIEKAKKLYVGGRANI